MGMQVEIMDVEEEMAKKRIENWAHTIFLTD